MCSGECMTPTHVARVRFQSEMPPQIPIIIINYNYSYCYHNYDCYIAGVLPTTARPFIG